MAIARSNSYEVDLRLEIHTGSARTKLQAYNSAHENPPSRAALGTRAFSIGKRQQNGPPGFKALEEAVANIHVCVLPTGCGNKTSQKCGRSWPRPLQAVLK